MQPATRPLQARYASPWLFFAGTFTLTWASWVPAALLGGAFTAPPHIMLNFTGELLNLSDRQESHVSLWIVLAAVAVTVVWGPETLAGRSDPPHRFGPE